MALLRKIFPASVVYTIEGFMPSIRIHRNKMKMHYRDFVRSQDLVFDIGANLGDRSKIFRALGGRVVAVEPTSYCVGYLKSLFNHDPAVVVVPKAVGQSIGQGEIHVNEQLPVLSTMSSKWINDSRFSQQTHWEKTEIISITTIDALIAEFGTPSFCKIDVEGFELQVLSGLSQPLPMLSFEFMYEFLDDAVACMDKILNQYNAKFNYNVGEEMDLVLAEWVSKERLLELLRDHKNPALWGDIYAKYEPLLGKK